MSFLPDGYYWKYTICRKSEDGNIEYVRAYFDIISIGLVFEWSLSDGHCEWFDELKEAEALKNGLLKRGEDGEFFIVRRPVGGIEVME